ncbi:hypothetical protein V501_08297 [Pseudogymnoascus sp. VKM F-4519 (FW-2642)]|nr:hypothetical protein V501_08297 [Pseudogymnoascus sp. VKM F-4519 (FW-2642)]
MDLAQTLVRSVMRAFYDTKHILVIDALIIHSALRDDDMAFLMGMNTKELHKLCGKLREDRFLAVHTRSETKEGQQRPINRTYYYIDYRATVDAIKWRVYRIDKNVQGNTIPKEERKEYVCPRCQSEWTQLEVLDKIDYKLGFLCHKCSYPLVPNEHGDSGGHEQSTRLNAQFRFITDLLPKIDQVVIPDSTFEVAYAAARPVIRDALLNPANETVPVDSLSNRPTAVKGLTNTGPTSIAVTVTASEGPTEADKAAEQARREAYLAQNVLPAHFTHSTVTGEQIIPTSQPAMRSEALEESKDKKDIVTTPSFSGDGAAIDDYFAQLKAEQAREAEKEAEDEFETDEDEDEDEDLGFEDVVPATGSGVGTPSSAVSDSKPHAGGLASALRKSKAGTGSPSGGTSTGVGSPATGPGTPESARASKKVRIEEPAAAEEVESEEDVEFEDV